jgi:murein DD-endopeptidase MepM/ murein hydrolase activator NlpD
MIRTLQQRAWRHISVIFPERQIYIRSDGRVQFFTFDPMMQAICAGAGLVVLGWVAFTSVNVIFKDRIIAAKERHFVEMQSSYENRIADLQISYDELNGALASAEDRFQSVASSFEAKQRAIANLLGHKQILQGAIGVAPAPAAAPSAPAPALRTLPAAPEQKPAYLGMNMGVGGILEDLVPNLSKILTPSSTTGISPLRGVPPFGATPPAALKAAVPPPAAAASERQTFLGGAVRRIGQFFGRKETPSSGVENPSLRHIAEAEARLAQLDEANPALLLETKQDVDKEVTRLTRILRTAGVDPKVLAASNAAAQGQGGPLLEIGPSQIATPDQSFNTAVIGTMSSLTSLNDIIESMRAVPLTTPLSETSVSSSFGARSDPFTENLAYHPGIDFPGAIGTHVHVTAPGVVVYAARFGDYGNMVEVDHGNRIRTRYAHLAKINVQIGARLEKGDVVGLLGSTGRSTGPHVHYEVWYDNVVRDPNRFIRAGHDVLKN